jgi:hypothetical protein
MLGGKARNYTTTDSYKRKFLGTKLKTINQALLGDTPDYHKKTNT